MNIKNGKDDPAAADNIVGGRQPGNFSLARQPSVYSLTFDEFMSTMGGPGKDFESMNMDELLKNIWTAEEMQTMAFTNGNQPVTGIFGGGHLQKQGSLTLPRTLSQKTVDEVWKDISQDGIASGPNFPQRQPTLGETTLEEFLVRAGVVREDIQLGDQRSNGGIFTDLNLTGNHCGLNIGYPQFNNGAGLVGSPISGNNIDRLTLQSPTNLPLNVNGIRSNQQQLPNSQPPQILPKQPALPYANPMPLMNNQEIKSGIVGLADQDLKGNIVSGSALQGGGINRGVHVATGSPANQLSCDETGKISNDTSSVSPVPYVFNGGLKGRRRSGAVEKVIERRQKRMIKNRESAARSRARKQAYTMELEEELKMLKEENEELRGKQDEIIENRRKQMMEMINKQRAERPAKKRRLLRRSQTGPW
ncbi:hypothetical protein K1719_010750 [Acacia pycnantha]|nr:hypothetical protein K1719_010750 [Acacia pycnantha]